MEAGQKEQRSGESPEPPLPSETKLTNKTGAGLHPQKETKKKKTKTKNLP